MPMTKKVSTERKTFRIRVQAFDINEFIQDKNGNPEPMIDVIVPVKTVNKARAEVIALKRCKEVIKAGWDKADWDMLGRWTTRSTNIRSIKVS